MLRSARNARGRLRPRLVLLVELLALPLRARASGAGHGPTTSTASARCVGRRWGWAELRDIPTGTVLLKVTDENGAVPVGLAFSADGNLLMVGGNKRADL